MRKRKLNELIDTLESKVDSMNALLKATIIERDLLALTNVDLNQELAALRRGQSQVDKEKSVEKDVVTPRTRTRKKVSD